MLDIKIQSLEKQNKLTPEQAAEFGRYTNQDESTYPTLGDRVRLVADPAEALSLLKAKRHYLLEISRSPRDPDEVFFVLRLKTSDISPTKRFGQPRTWLLFGIAMGAALSSMVQSIWPKTAPKAEPSGPVMIYPASQQK
jgi:hypothetical protein